MSINKEQVNNFYHGPVDVGTGISADYVVAHALRQRQRGKRPSIAYDGVRNPRIALKLAESHLQVRHLWDDGSTVGFGSVGILLHDDTSLPSAESRETRWHNPNGLVGLKYVLSGIPQTPLRGADYIPNDDGTVNITRPLPTALIS